MPIPKRKSLAGTCGIPREQERIYVRTFDGDGLEKCILRVPSLRKYQHLPWESGKSRHPHLAGNSGARYSGTCASISV